MAVSKRTRFEVLNRDNFTCRYCGQSAPDVKLHVDHVMPVSLGGADTPDNLVAACIDCNTGKASTNPRAETVAQVSEDAVRHAEAVKKIAAEMEDTIREEYKARSRSYENARDALCHGAGLKHNEDAFAFLTHQIDIPDDWFTTFVTFTELGLTHLIISDAFRIAWDAKGVADANVWRYFCGICWNRVRDIEARTKGSREAAA